MIRDTTTSLPFVEPTDLLKRPETERDKNDQNLKLKTKTKTTRWIEKRAGLFEKEAKKLLFSL